MSFFLLRFNYLKKVRGGLGCLLPKIWENTNKNNKHQTWTEDHHKIYSVKLSSSAIRITNIYSTKLRNFKHQQLGRTEKSNAYKVDPYHSTMGLWLMTHINGLTNRWLGVISPCFPFHSTKIPSTTFESLPQVTSKITRFFWDVNFPSGPPGTNKKLQKNTHHLSLQNQLWLSVSCLREKKHRNNIGLHLNLVASSWSEVMASISPPNTSDKTSSAPGSVGLMQLKRAPKRLGLDNAAEKHSGMTNH